MVVTDSRTRDVARPVFLTFATGDTDGEPAAHVVPDGRVVEALRASAGEAGVRLISEDAVKDFAVGAGDGDGRDADGQAACRAAAGGG